jgi:fumarate hydratase class I
MEPIDMAELKARGPKSKVEELRVELYDRVNALGIGAQGLGGLSTVLDVRSAPTPAHAANRPVAMIPNCGRYAPRAFRARRLRPRRVRSALRSPTGRR